jgi:hypothetical protein
MANLAEKTIEELQTAIQLASKNDDLINVMKFKAELNRRSKSQADPVGDTNIIEQGTSGINQAIASGFGFPVDMAAAGLSKLGVDVGDAPFGGSASIEKGMDYLTGGNAISDVAPQTTAQKYVRSGGEMIGSIPPLVASAPLVAGQKIGQVAQQSPNILNAAKEIVKDTASYIKDKPAQFVGTEAAIGLPASFAGTTAEQIFPNSPTAKMLAEIVGATVGVGGNAFTTKLLTKNPDAPTNSLELSQAASLIYEKQKQKGVVIVGDQTQKMFDAVDQMMRREGLLDPDLGLDTKIGAGASNLYNMFKNKAGKAMDGSAMLTFRKNLKARYLDALKRADGGTDAGAISKILNIFEEVSGNVNNDIKIANAMYHRASKADTLDTIVELARNRSDSNLNFDKALRNQFRTFTNRLIQGKEFGWSPDEIEQMKSIVQGGTTENILNFIGKFAPTNPTSLIATGGGSAYVLEKAGMADPTIIGGTVLGTSAATSGAKYAAGKMQQQNVDALIKNVLGGRKLSGVGQERAEAALRAYLINKGLMTAEETVNQ